MRYVRPRSIYLYLFTEGEAGNLAIRTMSVGGLYIGGGIAPKILEMIKSGLFMESFRKKGRFEGFIVKGPGLCYT